MRVIIIGILILTALTFNIGLADAAELVAVYTAEPITLNGNPSEAAWGTAEAIKIPVAGGLGATTVTMKALYDDENIYILAKWLDESKTESVHINAWIYKGGKWEEYIDPVTGRAEEDRFAMQWEIGDVEGFATRGCLALCHPGNSEWKESGNRMHTKNPGERTDEWHWKAARSNPLGVFHDKHIGSTVDPENVEAGHHADGKGFYSRNRNADKTGPEYIEASPDDKVDATFMLRAEVDGNDAIPLASFTGTIAEGTLVPGRILDPSKATGDVADPKVRGVFKDGYWTLEIKRALKTGSDKDVQFDPAKTHNFGVAVFDNSGHEPQHAYQVGVNTLRFAPKATSVSAPTAASNPAPLPAPKKGVCGPTALLLIGTLPLLIAGRRFFNR
jgi:hypothetical protein